MAYYKAQEIILQPVTEIKENYYLDEKDLSSINVIKIGFNSTEFPVFSKNDKIKENVAMRYIFNNNNEFLKVIPGSDPDNICNKILQEFEEKLFYGIKRIYQATGDHHMMGPYPYFMDWSGIPYKGRNPLRTKDGFQRLNGCMIVYNGIYYDAKARSLGYDYVKRTKTIRIIEGLETISYEKFRRMKDSEEKESIAAVFSKHKNIKEIINFRLSDDIVNELIYDSYRYFNHDELLKMKNGVARKLGMLLVKWQHWLKTDNFKRRCKLLASRVPLSWKHPSSTVRNLVTACEYLKDEKNYLDYRSTIVKNYNKLGRGKNAEIDFHLNKNNLYMVNDKLDISETGQEMLEIEKIEAENIIDIPYEIQGECTIFKTAPINSDTKNKPNNDFMTILESVPQKHQNTKKVHKLITKYLKLKGFNYVIRLVKFSAANSTGGFSGFLEGALENDWEAERRQSSQNNAIIKDIRNAKNGAARCYGNCKGGCGATWDRHQLETDMCFWCEKFARQKAYVESQAQHIAQPVAQPQPEPEPPKKHPLWEKIKKTLEQKLPEHTLRMWIYPMLPDFDKTTDDKLVLICPNAFSKKRTSDNFLKQINDASEGIEIVLK